MSLKKFFGTFGIFSFCCIAIYFLWKGGMSITTYDYTKILLYTNINIFNLILVVFFANNPCYETTLELVFNIILDILFCSAVILSLGFLIMLGFTPNPYLTKFGLYALLNWGLFISLGVAMENNDKENKGE